MALNMRGLALALVALASGTGALRAKEGDSGIRDPCRCLKWKEIYRRGEVGCGDGWEFSPGMTGGLSQKEVKFKWGKAFCSNFFRRLETNFCVNREFYDADADGDLQWCWVSSMCTSASPAPFSNVTSFRVKSCKKGSDPRLADLKVEELLDLAKQMGTDLRVMLQMAYPTESQMTWTEVAGIFEETDAEIVKKRASLVAPSPEIMAKMWRLSASQTPYVVPSANLELPYGLVRGSQAWRLDYGSASDEMKTLYPYLKTEAKCLNNCGQ